MKIQTIGSFEVVMTAEGERNFFAWPTVATLKNGNVAVGASGYRMAHICPFGVSCLRISEDGGYTFGPIRKIVDTPLDDRDTGLCPFGESGLILTTFNNSVKFQRTKALKAFLDETAGEKAKKVSDYLDTITPETEEKYLGVEFCVSFDNGETFGEIYHSPITSPHGPVELSNGKILWVGRIFSAEDKFIGEADHIYVYTVDPQTGKMEKVGTLPDLFDTPDMFGTGEKLVACEPYMIEMPDGTLLCHIRAQRSGEKRIFTTYQTTSTDGGKTWTEPERILDVQGGAPSHLLRTSDGITVMTYGIRPFGTEEPGPGVRGRLSTDDGKTWGEEFVLYSDTNTRDVGYPSTVECSDGTFLTVFYAHPDGATAPAKILSQRWRIER